MFSREVEEKVGYRSIQPLSVLYPFLPRRDPFAHRKQNRVSLVGKKNATLSSSERVSKKIRREKLEVNSENNSGHTPTQDL